jgi:hypothetical protein
MVGALAGGHPVGHAAAGAALVEAEHQAGPLRRAAVDEGIDAQRPVRAHEPCLDPFEEVKARPPDQRAVAKNPELFGEVFERRVHDARIICWRQ